MCNVGTRGILTGIYLSHTKPILRTDLYCNFWSTIFTVATHRGINVILIMANNLFLRSYVYNYTRTQKERKSSHHVSVERRINRQFSTGSNNRGIHRLHFPSRRKVKRIFKCNKVKNLQFI